MSSIGLVNATIGWASPSNSFIIGRTHKKTSPVPLVDKVCDFTHNMRLVTKSFNNFHNKKCTMF